MGDRSQNAPAARAQRIVLALTLGVCFVAYARTLKFQFVWDDHQRILENPIIRSWRFLPRYFTEHVWQSIDPLATANYYRPLFLLWLRLNAMFFGFRPWGWHLTSVLAHLAVTLLVYFVAFRLLEDRLTSALAAMIFGLHPAHIESVAWVSAIPEPLVALLLLGSFLTYLRAEDSGRPGRWKTISLLLFALGLLTKETAVVLPGIIFVHGLVGGRPNVQGKRVGLTLLGRPPASRRGALRAAMPFILLVPFYLVARGLALKGLAPNITPLPLSVLILTWPSLLWVYLRLLIWPATISPSYDAPYIWSAGLTNFLVPAVALLAAALLLVMFWQKLGSSPDNSKANRDARVIPIAAAWLFFPLLPLLDLRVLPKGEPAHARYLYLPSIGFSLLVALALRFVVLPPRPSADGLPSSTEEGSPRGLTPRGTKGWWAKRLPLEGILGVLLALPYALVTLSQSRYWANDAAYYTRAMATAPNNIYIKTNLASFLGERGQYDRAIDLYQQVLGREPSFWLANYNLGYTYYRIGKLDLAERYLNRAMAIYPNKPDQYLYLGLTELKEGRVEDAARALRAAVPLKPTAPGFHFALGMVLKLQGDTQEANREFLKELTVNPNELEARKQIDQMAKGDGRTR